jgi:hypothetical protein
MKTDIVFILFVTILGLMAICFFGSGTVQQGLQKDAKMLELASPYLQDCEFGTIRHFKGLNNHDWSEIWACKRKLDGLIESATLICMEECSKTIVSIMHPNWDKLEKSVVDGEYKEVK